MGKTRMAKTANDYLALAQWAQRKYQNNPGVMAHRGIRDKYVDTLAYFLDVSFDTALEMAKDNDFRLPKEEKKKN
jgi:hypothetical protein